MRALTSGLESSVSLYKLSQSLDNLFNGKRSSTYIYSSSLSNSGDGLCHLTALFRFEIVWLILICTKIFRLVPLLPWLSLIRESRR